MILPKALVLQDECFWKNYSRKSCYYPIVYNAYAFKGQVHGFAGRVKIVSHSSCRTGAILKKFCALLSLILNAPITAKVVCFSCLLKCLRSLYGIQCEPRSDCSGSTLFASILSSSVMLGNYLQQTTSADDNFRLIFSKSNNDFLYFQSTFVNRPAINCFPPGDWVTKLRNALLSVSLNLYNARPHLGQIFLLVDLRESFFFTFRVGG